MISVAIIEDHEKYRQSLQAIVNESSFFELKGAYASAEDAITGLLETPPDIAVVDIKLKGITGIELVRQTNLSLPNT